MGRACLVARQCWSLPGKGFVKLNVDGGCVEVLSTSGGAVIRGMDGKALVLAAWKVLGVVIC